MNVYELYFGYFKLKNSKHKVSKQVIDKERIALENLVKSLKVYDLTSASAIKSAEIYHELSSKGEILEIFDCLIASIIISSFNHDLLTGNSNHFKRITELNLVTLT